MEYEEWRDLSDKMAVEGYVSEAGSLMIEVARSRPVAERMALEARTVYTDDAKVRPPKHIYDWRNRVHDMGAALIALEKLGYAVVKCTKAGD